MIIYEFKTIFSILSIPLSNYKFDFDSHSQIDNPISDDEESDLDEDLLADKHLQQELEDSSHVYGIFSAVDLKSSLVDSSYLF